MGMINQYMYIYRERCLYGQRQQPKAQSGQNKGNGQRRNSLVYRHLMSSTGAVIPLVGAYSHCSRGHCMHKNMNAWTLQA